MRARSFRGGVHPPGNKHWTERKPIEDMPLPRRVIIPLAMHTGAPAKALVKEGDTVRAGQPIGEPGGFVSAAVHASISGRVTAVLPHLHPAMPTLVPTVVIETPEGESPDGGSWPAPADWSGFSADDLRARIRDAGVVGMGGAAFPTHVKLTPPKERPIDALILNGVECEPYLTADHRLMLEQADAVIGGARIFMKILGLARASLGIESNKPDAIAFLAERCRALEAPIDVVPLKVKYPQGAEKQLIKAILNREVPSGGLPFDVGVVVQNVGTAAAVHDAVARGKPLVDRVVTVTGAGVKEPRNLRVRIGTTFADVIARCGGFASEEGERKIIMGGPMMGLAQYSLDVPVVKGTSGILVLSDGVRAGRETTCIKCGRCVAVCPVYLMPNRISDYAEIDKFDQANEYGVRDCIECGACAYICDVKRPIVHLVKYAKLNLAKKKQAAPGAAQGAVKA
jgi:Na+-translocating ferredoxin:NAD+ oxidoreductase subunit C